jgi:2-hydroxycyclohexanecarboxyl-CoA dehydrogenase
LSVSVEPTKPVAFVAGGSGGLGAAICRTLAATHRIVFTYRAGVERARVLVQELADAGGDAVMLQADLTHRPDAEKVLAEAAQLGSIKTLVYASGPNIAQKYFSVAGAEEWNQSVNAEMQAFFNLMHVGLPILRNSGASSVVAVTSFATTRVVPGDVLSSVPKAGIEMLVRQIAREEGRFGIRANSVGPGIIDAGLGLRTQQEFYSPEIWETQRKSVPLRRFGTAEDIARVVAFLASDNAAYVTGQLINVDGGMSV